MLSLSVVVVLYKKHFESSVAVSSLLSSFDAIKGAGFLPVIYVWNNSPGFSPCLDRESVVWLEGDNSTLPFIYNSVAELAFGSGSSILMISDDDTDYSNFDFTRHLGVVRDFVLDKSKSEVTGCFVPCIQSGGRLVSPGGRILFKGYLLNQVRPGLVSSKKLLAINSGTILTRSCYERMRPLYNERLNFYGTDTDFFVRYEDFYKCVYVLDSEINHSLSSDGDESMDRMLFRWRDNIHAMNIIFEKRSFFFKLAMHAYYFFVKVKLSIRFCDRRFLKIW
ncbi:hypothetical protein [Zestomonas carbonaria]|uniref:Glycosyltransferase n=1 Tax=Zestomonas carbonaria TaxID=2762745 RepID=A0A7U7ER93_9GAMM|nr:hypothetical protein [Pseudomonas carbonaria]CAD5109712.1 hypothetical protein PSEWESI4_04018 [Pseudomonas carbonaria]